MRFKVFEGAMNAAILIDFFKRMAQERSKERGSKVFLALDNLKGHHAKPVKAWLEKNKQRMQVFYLPSYSPELEPRRDGQCEPQSGGHSQGAQSAQGPAQGCGHRTSAAFVEITQQGQAVLSEKSIKYAA